MTSAAVPEDWFLVQLKPNGQLRAVTNLERQGFQTFAPLKSVTERRGGRLRPAEKPLFPGYVFVALPTDKPVWRKVNSTYGVARLVALDSRGPTPVPRGLVEAIRARCDADGRVMAPESFAPGEQVRVVAGPFTAQVARIEAVPDRDRVYVLFQMMGQEVRAQVSARDLEKT